MFAPKTLLREWKDKLQTGRKIFANHISNKALVPRIKDSQNSIGEKINNSIRKWAKEKNRHFTKQHIQIANKHMKITSISSAIREIQIKRSYLYIPIRIAKMKNRKNTKCWWGCRETGSITHCWWEREMIQLLWKTVW